MYYTLCSFSSFLPTKVKIYRNLYLYKYISKWKRKENIIEGKEEKKKKIKIIPYSNT